MPSAFDLDNSFDQRVVLDNIKNIPYLNERTTTGMLMANTGFTEARGALPLDLAIPHVGIVLTDGEVNEGVDVHIAAQAANPLKYLH